MKKINSFIKLYIYSLTKKVYLSRRKIFHIYSLPYYGLITYQSNELCWIFLSVSSASLSKLFLFYAISHHLFHCKMGSNVNYLRSQQMTQTCKYFHCSFFRITGSWKQSKGHTNFSRSLFHAKLGLLGLLFFLILQLVKFISVLTMYNTPEFQINSYP